MTTDFIYCPRCATKLESRSIGISQRPTCPACGFIHFLDPKVAVIALISCAGQVLLTQRAVEPELGKWALPGGYMDAGEMPDSALRRELREELELEIDEPTLFTILPMSGGHGIVLAYTATPASGRCESLPCHDDVADAQWFLPNELPSELAFASTAKLLRTWLSMLA